MQLTTAIQEALIALLCFDDSPGGAKLVKGLVPVNYYDAYYADIAQVAAKYLDRYDKPAGEHLLDLVNNLKKKDKDKADIYQQLYESLLETKDGVNRDYVVSQARVFARYQQMMRFVRGGPETPQVFPRNPDHLQPELRCP